MEETSKPQAKMQNDTPKEGKETNMQKSQLSHNTKTTETTGGITNAKYMT